MGYETKLLIGKEGAPMPEWERGDWVYDTVDDTHYRESKKDQDGNLIYTGRSEIWFQVYATVDLCKCGYDSELYNLESSNDDESKVWFFFAEDGNTQVKEDHYGTQFKPVPIAKVMEALKKDAERDDYRRFKWAIALLESMANDPEDLSVILYGH